MAGLDKGSESDARLRHFAATTAFVDELVTTNAANKACRAGRLRCNGEVASGARVVAAGDVLTLEAAVERAAWLTGLTAEHAEPLNDPQCLRRGLATRTGGRR